MEAIFPGTGQKVLVFIDRSDLPETMLCEEGTTLEKIRKNNEWLETKTGPAKEIIRTLGGIVLSESWFYAGLRVCLPEDDIESHMEALRQAKHVKGVVILE